LKTHQSYELKASINAIRNEEKFQLATETLPYVAMSKDIRLEGIDRWSESNFIPLPDLPPVEDAVPENSRSSCSA
jgi:hypothetical protein